MAPLQLISLASTTMAALLLAACGGGTAASGGAAPTGGSGSTPAPTLSFAASALAAGSSTLNWSTTDATACTASDGWSGTKGASGTQTVTPSATSTYTLACSGAGGSVMNSVTVTVTPVTPLPAVSFTATPASLASGSTSVLKWSSSNATTCNASGAWSGTKATSGSFTTPAITAAASYTLACSGAGGSTSSTLIITLQDSTAPTATSASTLGTLTVQSYSSGIATTANFQTPTVWYPTNGGGRYPGVVFVPGFTSDYLHPQAPLDETAVTQWADFLASHGFVVMFINSANIALDGPPQKQAALLDAVNALAAEDTRSGSPVAGLVQVSNIAVMGHSFGGAAALFAANAGSNPRIKAVVALSPVPNNSNFGPYPNDTVPTLIYGGQGDPGGFQGEYDTLPAASSKLLAIFLSTSEYSSMHNIARNPLGSHGTDPLVARYGLSFLEVYLAGDARYQQFLVNDPLLQVFAYNP